MSLYDKRIELVGFEEDEGRDKFQYDEVNLKKAIQEFCKFANLSEYQIKVLLNKFGRKLCVEDLNDGGEDEESLE